ncbi:hypothetical protein HK100_005835 [Physocladia obscura]|uniref:Uncharacterized protein n=1 Tax=Physocladia obscura TaxID=109957 RepID=A0AAD5X942_9FUNG|nr:hypothetical protein HK100_005835 [Physocladia obscura]
MYDIDRIHRDIMSSFAPETATWHPKRLSLYLSCFIAYLAPIQNSSIDKLFIILSLHPSDRLIQIDTSAVLANLSNVAHARKHIQRCSHTSTLLINMTRWSHEETVQTELCAILSNLAQSESENGDLARAGACELLRDAMTRHTESEDLQVQALNALAGLARSAKRVLPETTMRMHVAGVLAVLDAWTVRASMATCAAACNALGVFSFAGVRVPCVATAEGSVLRAMQKFRACAKFQVTACFALAHLCICVNEGGGTLGVELVDEVLAIMSSFPRHKNVLTTAAFALGSFALQSDTNRTHIMTKKGIDIVVKSMMETEFDEEVNCLEVCMKHMTVSGEPTDGENEVDGNYLGSNNKPTQKSHLLKLFGSMFLMNLSENEKCRQEIIKRGGLDAIFDAASYIFQTSQSKDLGFVLMYNAVLRDLKSNFDSQKPIFFDLAQQISDNLAEMQVPENVRYSLSHHVECKRCGVLFDVITSITGHEVYGKDKPTVTRFCGRVCLDIFDKDSRKTVHKVEPCFDV